MPEIKINPLFNVHDKYNRVNIINPYRFASGGGGASYEPETIMYMYEIGIADDATPTIYTGITGNNLWVIVNNLVVGLKTNSLFSKCHKVTLKLGNTIAQQRVELLNPSVLGVFFGNWVLNETGAIANGTDCHFYPRYTPNNIANTGLTIVINNEGTGGNSFAIAAGSYSSATQRINIYTKSSSINSSSTYIGNAIAEGVAKTPRGVYSISRIGSSGTYYKDKVILGTNTSMSGSLPIQELSEGAGARGGNIDLGSPSANNYFQGTIGSSVYHEGLTSAETNALTDILNDFEAAINRKNY